MVCHQIIRMMNRCKLQDGDGFKMQDFGKEKIMLKSQGESKIFMGIKVKMEREHGSDQNSGYCQVLAC